MEIVKMYPTMKWTKVVNRRSSVSFLYAIAEQKSYFEKLGDYEVGYFWADDITKDVAYSESELMTLGEKIAGEIKKDVGFARENASMCRRLCNEVVRASRKLHSTNPERLSNERLAVVIKKVLDPYYNLIPFLLIPHSVERFLLNKVEGLVNSRVAEKHREKYMEWLTVPVDEDIEEIESALTIAGMVKERGWNRKTREKLGKHAESFRWLPMWGINIDPLKDSYFKKEIDSLVDRFDNPTQEIKVLRKKARIRKALAEDAIRELKPNKAMRAYIQILQSYIFLRTYRKSALCQAHYVLRPFFKEVAGRMRISQKDVYNLTYHELLGLLAGQMIDQEVFKKRRQGWAILGWRGEPMVFSGKRAISRAVKKYSVHLPTIDLDGKVEGDVACRGKVRGVVKVATSIDQLDKVKKGDILVAVMTTPDYMSAIYRCGAMVTNEGGVTCHAAIVSREFEIPCIVGTKNATLALKDGDYVEVDAEKGIVRKVEK